MGSTVTSDYDNITDTGASAVGASLVTYVLFADRHGSEPRSAPVMQELMAAILSVFSTIFAASIFHFASLCASPTHTVSITREPKDLTRCHSHQRIDLQPLQTARLGNFPRMHTALSRLRFGMFRHSSGLRAIEYLSSDQHILTTLIVTRSCIDHCSPLCVIAETVATHRPTNAFLQRP